MDILHIDDDIIVCIKPPRVLSTDEPGGLPDLVREALGDPEADVRTVHRLDRVVSGVMVLARSKASASELSRQIREDEFRKEYLAIVHGCPEEPEGEYRDLLGRDKARKMTMITNAAADTTMSITTMTMHAAAAITLSITTMITNAAAVTIMSTTTMIMDAIAAMTTKSILMRSMNTITTMEKRTAPKCC